MSLVLLANFCSHLQNATKARLGTTSVPSTRQILLVSLLLQSSGFISSVTRGSVLGPDEVYTPTTQENVSTRRIWLGLKYLDNEPVMSRLNMVSKPTKRIYVGYRDLKELAMGRDANYVKGLAPGEVMVVSTDRGIMEAREAAEMLLGGQLLCRVN
ncbi:ribosomal protein S8 [Kalaharituber pfeilii]|nr:ribosomal protein S8 [Kalaharituber pfeilii]